MRKNLMLNEIRDSLQEAQSVLEDFLLENGNLVKIDHAAKKLAQALMAGGKAISCGNGGSMCDAMHFAEELTGRFKKDRASLPAVAVSDPAYLSCVANDYGYDAVFSRFVEGVGVEGDFLLAISTSGNSANVIRAVEAAKRKKIFSCCLLGKDGGRLAGMCDASIIVRSEKTERIQEVHIKIIHILISLAEQILSRHDFISIAEATE